MAISTELYVALSTRARAGRQWPEIGFHDQAAKILAQLLGVNLQQRNDPQWERRYLQRSQWFDQRCRDFFTRYPRGMCIDLGAGLSTRFHRLSQSDDWPRFRWVDVDLPDVIALKAAVMPGIDNYKLVGADILREDWLLAAGWRQEIPLIITLEAVMAEFNMGEVSRLLANIARQCAGRVVIEIAFDYAVGQSTWKHLLGRLLPNKFPSLLELFGRSGFSVLRMDTLPGSGAVGVLAQMD